VKDPDAPAIPGVCNTERTRNGILRMKNSLPRNWFGCFCFAAKNEKLIHLYHGETGITASHFFEQEESYFEQLMNYLLVYIQYDRPELGLLSNNLAD
jgi:hypothetical protein